MYFFQTDIHQLMMIQTYNGDEKNGLMTYI